MTDDTGATSSKRKAEPEKDTDVRGGSEEDMLVKFQDSLESVEVGYRALVRDAIKEAANAEASMYLQELLPGEETSSV